MSLSKGWISLVDNFMSFMKSSCNHSENKSAYHHHLLDHLHLFGSEFSLSPNQIYPVILEIQMKIPWFMAPQLRKNLPPTKTGEAKHKTKPAPKSKRIQQLGIQTTLPQHMKVRTFLWEVYPCRGNTRQTENTTSMQLNESMWCEQFDDQLSVLYDQSSRIEIMNINFTANVSSISIKGTI